MWQRNKDADVLKFIHQHAIPLAHVFLNRVPFDPFTDAERDAVRTFLETQPPTLGERTLERIDRSRVAIARLAAAMTVPITTLQDVWLDGPRLPEEVASLMAVEGAA